MLSMLYREQREEKHVFISIDQDEYIVSILVEDNGTGRSEEQLNYMFDNGYSTKNQQNHGIGLYLIQGIVQKENGNIIVSTNFGEGTSFQVSFY
ncbi:ATP-binding protein [Psychrobacillus sp. NPDC096426]|uniref:ATP-binding protein n=1 Tax=Psychrobacillus sp. NPDC096426 TaxID=3364491 RepID=UPI003829E1D9